uniref:Putative lipocalin n=1 Tax=Ixodes ricinus TaxID=34613 RepID=V5H6U3_IXORI
MWIEYVVMGLQYALLFACVAAVEVWALYEGWTPNFHWTEKMTIKNPENNPTFNYPELGPLQDAWQENFQVLLQFPQEATRTLIMITPPAIPELLPSLTGVTLRNLS